MSPHPPGIRASLARFWLRPPEGQFLIEDDALILIHQSWCLKGTDRKPSSRKWRSPGQLAASVVAALWFACDCGRRAAVLYAASEFFFMPSLPRSRLQYPTGVDLLSKPHRCAKDQRASRRPSSDLRWVSRKTATDAQADLYSLASKSRGSVGNRASAR
jgi:hypothetical protein